MKVSALEESAIQSIGRAFACYDYKGEPGLIDAFPRRSAAAAFICGYVRIALQNGMLYTTSEQGEAYLAYTLPGQKIRFRSVFPLAKVLFGSMNLKELLHFASVMSRGGAGLRRQLDRERKPYLYVGLLCVPEPYQGKGCMRKALELAFAEGERLGVPVILDTDARSKCEKYLHLGMQLAGTRRFGSHGQLYELIKYPACAGEKGRESK